MYHDIKEHTQLECKFLFIIKSHSRFVLTLIINYLCPFYYTFVIVGNYDIQNTINNTHTHTHIYIYIYVYITCMVVYLIL